MFGCDWVCLGILGNLWVGLSVLRYVFCMFSYVSILVFVLANDEQGYHQG